MTGARRAGARHLDVELDIDLAGLLEPQRDGNLIALLQGRLDIDEHHVLAAGRKRHVLPWRDGDAAGNLAHRHDAVLHAGCMHLDAPCSRRLG
jgi:hypothetical protein